MKILKFGGTSVGSAVNMKSVAAIVLNEGAKVTVLSAMSQTTDTLVRIVEASKNGRDISLDIKIIKDKYYCCIDNLLVDNISSAKEAVDRVIEIITNEFENFVPHTSEGLILSQGELLTTAIFTMYLKETGKAAELIDITKMMRLDENGKVDERHLKTTMTAYIKQYSDDTIFVTQGFICVDNNGVTTNLGRGGSDYSAALIGAAISASEVQIWTDIDGMHNNDPRYVEGTYPIRHLSFDQAAELAYFGAKILHPATAQPCKAANIPVHLKNTMDPKSVGTIISNEDNQSSTYQAVAAKDGITLIRICSTRMLMAYGFLRKVFEIFEEYKTPIDMITTSEVAVSLTIDNDVNLEPIVQKLEELGSIEIEKNNSIVCVVGILDHSHSGVVESILFGLKNVPIKMISYGASDRSIAMLVSSDSKIKALRALNEKLFV
ncbi:MAG: aspartate kinase [Rikenellaceae bacterium]